MGRTEILNPKSNVMKTFVPVKNVHLPALLMIFSITSMFRTEAQSISSPTNGLVFKTYILKSGVDLKKGAVYLFTNVGPGINATVSIDTLVNGASVTKIDDNTSGLGYTDAFQPEVQIGGKGESYALFTISFKDATTGLPVTLQSVQGTALDIDGNATLKEFADINMNGGTATYMGTTLEILLKSIPIVNTLFNEYRADNIMGIEHTGIDTSGKGVMYTVSNTNVSSFTVKYGATSTSSTNTSRQNSLYMKAFQYPSQVILPLNLLSFTAGLNSNKTDLNWTTSAEKNVSHFTIERSEDGKNFSDIATVFAFGNTSATDKREYSYTDDVKNAKSNIVYYRLRCVDEDGKYSYSSVRIIRLGEEMITAKAIAYPNPFTNELRVTLPQQWQNKELRLELYNGNGQLVKQKNINTASQTETISTNELGRGLYILNVTSGLERIDYKVIKY
jgi:hypothetical protein